MDYFLTGIKVNKIYHLEDFEIKLDDKERKHLILTGRNGSGKTVLLEKMQEFLDDVHNTPDLHFLHAYADLEKNLKLQKQKSLCRQDI